MDDSSRRTQLFHSVTVKEKSHILSTYVSAYSETPTLYNHMFICMVHILTKALFAHAPHQSIRYFKGVIMFSFVKGVMIGVPTIDHILQSWDSTSYSAFTLRWYHIIRVALFLLQLPFRVYMFSSLVSAQQERQRPALIDRLLILCRSREWSINQYFGIAINGLFVIGCLIAYTNWGVVTEEGVHELYYLLWVNMSIFLLQIFMCFTWLNR